MLTNAKVAALLAMTKRFVDQSTVNFPTVGSYLTRELESDDGREAFLVDVNRKGIKLSKCTYQNRYQVTEILLRLDIDGPTHDNPDGTVSAMSPLARLPRRLRRQMGIAHRPV